MPDLHLNVLRTHECVRIIAPLTFLVKGGEHLILVFVKPPTLLHQQNIVVRAYGSLASYDKKEYDITKHKGNVPLESEVDLYQVEVQAKQDDIYLTLEFEYDLRQRFLDEAYPDHINVKDQGAQKWNKELTAEDRARFLKSDSKKYNFDDERFQAWLDGMEFRRRPNESDVAFGYRVLTNFRRSIQVRNFIFIL